MMRLSKIVLSVVGLTVLVSIGMSPAEAALIGAGSNNMNAPIYSIDTTTGVQTLLGNSGLPNVQALAFSPTGVLYGTAGTSGNQSLITINQTTGAATVVAPINGPDGVSFITGLGFSPSGTVYAVGRNFDQVGSLYTLDITTGTEARIGTTNAVQIQDMAFSPSGAAFAVNIGSAGVPGSLTTRGVRSLDLATGNTTFLGPAGGSTVNLTSMTFTPDGTLWIGGGGNLYTADTTTGALSQQYTGLATFSALAAVAPVPVPAAIWLFGSGLAAMVGFARRKSSSNSY
ncbi:MAG TPA: WD40 repeat domain-containing protein [Nitrospira sp.]|nr:WD40 repeat domain-containing protein [Nitrospira sp.]